VVVVSCVVVVVVVVVGDVEKSGNDGIVNDGVGNDGKLGNDGSPVGVNEAGARVDRASQ
jgi:hypothetical protein